MRRNEPQSAIDLMEKLKDELYGKIRTPAQTASDGRSCDDFSGTAFTSVTFDITQLTSHPTKFQGCHRMKLQESPQEHLTVDYRINLFNTTTSCNLTLRFDRDPRMVLQDYCYEISFKALVEIDGKRHHLPLFSHTETRTNDWITLRYKPLDVNERFKYIFASGDLANNLIMSNQRVLHLCCGVRRFKKPSLGKVTVENSVAPAAESCCDITEEAFTSVVFRSDSRTYAQEFKDSHRMTLRQHPAESLTLDYCIRNYGQNATTYACSLTLRFDNFIHEMSHDYGYEVSLKALIWDKGKTQHIPLITLTKAQRKEGTIRFVNEEFQVTDELSDLFNKVSIGKPFSNVKAYHVCCHVRRFHKSSNEATAKNPALPYSLGEDLLRHHLHSDVCIKVGQSEFKVHRAVLALRSSVFRAMFSHEETSESRTGLVTVHDIEAPVLEEMLRYVYTGCAKVGISEFPVELFKAAHKYDIAELVAECEEALMFEVKFDNVVEHLDLASLYDLKTFKRGAMAFVAKHEEKMVREPSFQDFLCRDLSIDTLVYTLKLGDKYKLANVKAAGLKFAKRYPKEVSSKKEFLDLFVTHPYLMQEIFVYMHDGQRTKV